MQEALAADCLDLLSTVFTRFGEHVKDRWNVTQTLLSTMAKGTHATSRKAVLCIRTPPPIHPTARVVVQLRQCATWHFSLHRQH